MAPAQGQSVDRTLADLGLESVSVRGTHAQATAFVPVPPGWAVAGGSVDLRWQHSPLLRGDVSTVTLAAGDRPLGSARLTRDRAADGRLSAELPALPAARGGVVVAARFSMRLTRDECEDPQNAALWARMLDTTRVKLRLVPAQRTLRDALAALAPGRSGDVLDVVLPPTAAPAALEAAGTAVAGAARSNAAGAATLVRAVDTAGERPALVVGAGDDRPPARAGAVSISPSGPPQVALAGDDGGLPRAAAWLAESRLGAASGSRAVVTEPPPPAPAEARPWRESAASFAQLGIEPREVAGEGVTQVDLALDRPPSWTLREDPELELHVAAGAGLQRTSSLTVSVDGREVGGERLVPQDRPQRIAFRIPRGLVDTDLDGGAVRSIRLSLRFDLDAERRRCEPTDLDGVRAVLLDTSKVTLEHRTTDALDLSRFPAPMEDRVHVVVPADPRPAELTAGLQAAAALGRWSDPGAPLPRLTTARALGEARGNADLVLVGDADRELGETVGTTPSREPATGMLTLRESPWTKSRRVVALDGDDEGLLLAARALTGRESVERLIGSAVRIRATGAPEPTAPGSPAGDPPLLLAPVEDRSLSDRVPVWAVPAGVVLVALLAIGAVVVRRRWLARSRP